MTRIRKVPGLSDTDEETRFEREKSTWTRRVNSDEEIRLGLGKSENILAGM